jgi:hypothetical protein
MILPPLEPAYRDESNGSGFILLRPLDAELFDKISRSRHFTFCATVLRHLTFCLISRHPVVVEEWSYRHWNQLIETNPMIVVSSFYDNWMPRYLTKRQQIGILHFAILRHSTFCQISRHLVVVEGWNHHHWIRHDMPVLMAVRSSFYDRWMPSYFVNGILIISTY